MRFNHRNADSVKVEPFGRYRLHDAKLVADWVWGRLATCPACGRTFSRRSKLQTYCRSRCGDTRRSRERRAHVEE